jgi:hypothetical protein
MKLELLAQVIQDAGIGTIGEDIYVHNMPADVTRGIMLRNPLAGTNIDNGLPGYFRDRLQAIVRATSHADGDVLAKQVTKALKMERKRLFLDTDGKLLLQINYLLPAQLPIVYPWTPANVLEWSINFITSYVEPE